MACTGENESERQRTAVTSEVRSLNLEIDPSHTAKCKSALETILILECDKDTITKEKHIGTTFLKDYREYGIA